MQVGAKKIKIKGYGLVRGPDGKPKFDDINNIPEVFWNMLTDAEKQEIEDERNASRHPA